MRPAEGCLADDVTWSHVRGLAASVEQRLAADDIRLTIGAEPTFVSVADRQSRAWWVDPLGGNKEMLAWRLASLLACRWAPEAVPVWARGKMYPGEPRPRWAITSAWPRHEQVAPAGQFAISPDPGVLEVNIPPTPDWEEWEVRMTELYGAAAEAALDTRRFLLGGRTTGTGGGCHILLGGAAPQDDLFHRRPDLLASMVRYWHNHPSLSYAFAGGFVGPFSPYPRADEARPGAVHELETALVLLAAGRGAPEEVLRHVLIDMGSNRHRAEFCIDKLACPSDPEALGGLLELRAFEMQPTARMTLLVHLLVRAIVAWLAQTPYRSELERWGSRLHDAYMLPAVLREDLRHVLDDLDAAGLGLDPEWFAPLWDSRFPLLGEAHAGGVGIELRQALEPWVALDPGRGHATLVDSSIERLEVRLTGHRASTCTVLCNGYALHLHPLEASFADPAPHGGTVRGCGVRYRAWVPFDGLHPSVAPHAPLTFEVRDAAGKTPVRCVYHTQAVDGVEYPAFPVDEEEAARRACERFVVVRPDAASAPSTGRATEGRMQRVGVLSTSPEYHVTTDLLRADVAAKVVVQPGHSMPEPSLYSGHA